MYGGCGVPEQGGRREGVSLMIDRVEVCLHG